jgi:ABC-type multidrug transport system fused ATPase/permease subunit
MDEAEIRGLIDKHGAEAASAILAERMAVADRARRGFTLREAFGSGSEASRDPVEQMHRVLSDANEHLEDWKPFLIAMSNTRFANRRRMAYISLGGIIATTVFVGLAIVVDGTRLPPEAYVDGVPQYGMVALLAESSSTIAWMLGFFASIVAFYFGASALRPSS